MAAWPQGSVCRAGSRAGRSCRGSGMALAQLCTPCQLLPAWGEGDQAAKAAGSAQGTLHSTSLSWLQMATGTWQHPLVPSPGQTAHAGAVALLGLLLRGDLFATGQGGPWLTVPSHPLQGCGDPVGMSGKGGAVSQSWGHQAGGCSPCRIRLPVLPRYGRFYRCVALFHLPEGDENAVTAESLPLQQTRLLPSSALLLSLPSPSSQYPHEDPDAWAGPCHPILIPTPRHPIPRALVTLPGTRIPGTVGGTPQG